MAVTFDSRTTSATGTALAVVVDNAQSFQSLSILMAASAGTATLVVEVSVDNTTWLTVDSIAAAQFTGKAYGAGTAGAAAASATAGPLIPLSFRFIRITAGAAGGGNTTTLTISTK